MYSEWRICARVRRTVSGPGKHPMHKSTNTIRGERRRDRKVGVADERQTEEIDTLSSTRHWDVMEMDEPNASGRKPCPGFFVSLATFSGQLGQGPRCSATGDCADDRRLGHRQISGRQIDSRPKRNRCALEFSGTQPGAMVGNSVMTQAPRTSKVAALDHGLRSSFKDWAVRRESRRAFCKRADEAA